MSIRSPIGINTGLTAIPSVRRATVQIIQVSASRASAPTRLEQNIDIRMVQVLLGHSRLGADPLALHLRIRHRSRVEDEVLTRPGVR
jgi:site-specific recombinase XerC